LCVCIHPCFTLCSLSLSLSLWLSFNFLFRLLCKLGAQGLNTEIQFKIFYTTKHFNRTLTQSLTLTLYTQPPSLLQPPLPSPNIPIMSGKQDLSKYSYQAMSSLVVDQGKSFPRHRTSGNLLTVFRPISPEKRRA
jgi:hypothetical protein